MPAGEYATPWEYFKGIVSEHFALTCSENLDAFFTLFPFGRRGWSNIHSACGGSKSTTPTTCCFAGRGISCICVHCKATAGVLPCAGAPLADLGTFWAYNGMAPCSGNRTRLKALCQACNIGGICYTRKAGSAPHRLCHKARSI